MPNKNLLLNSPQHDQNELRRRGLREYSERDAQAASQLRRSQNYGEAFAHPNALTTLLDVRHMAPSARKEDRGHHQTQQQQSQILKPRQLRKHGAPCANGISPLSDV